MREKLGTFANRFELGEIFGGFELGEMLSCYRVMIRYLYHY